MITEQGIIKNILSDTNLSKSILEIKEYPLPKPHIPIKKAKAFILGADPSNFSINGKETRRISCVFDIGKDKRYFSSINQNLREIGLSFDNIYVQNMIRNYTDRETQHNPKWNFFAEKWLPYVKQEFDLVDPVGKIPVFVTAVIILKFLLLNPQEIKSANEYYYGMKEIPITANQIKLERNIIPLYRHKDYSLKKHPTYLKRINEILSI